MEAEKVYSPFQIADEDEDIVLDAAIRLMNSCKPESNEARKDNNAVFFSTGSANDETISVPKTEKRVHDVCKAESGDEMKFPILPDYLKSADIIYSPLSPQNFSDSVLDMCAGMYGTILANNKEPSKIKFKVCFKPYMAIEDVVVKLTMYTEIVEGIPLSVLHVMKRQGDLFEYHKIFKAFMKQIVDFKDYDAECAPKLRKCDVEYPLSDEIELLP